MGTQAVATPQTVDPCPQTGCGFVNGAEAVHCAQCGTKLPGGRLGITFWLLNVIEMFERLAFYTLRPVMAVFVAQANIPGGLELTAAHKGTILSWQAIVQSILPMVTGGYADRYGYKATLAFSVTINVLGYLIMAFTHSYEGFFAGVLVVAFGTAFFKPSFQATLGYQLSKKASSLGWGIFYWIVNVGALLGHLISPVILGPNYGENAWRNLFLCCAGFTACNYLMLLTYKDVPTGASRTESPFAVLAKTIVNVFEPRLIIWILIMACFWAMMYQLWDTQPNFILDWVDSSTIAAHVPISSWSEPDPTHGARVPQQIILSLNSFLIVGLVVPVSWAVRKMRTLTAMFFGMIMATIGVVVAGMTMNGWWLLAGIIGFSLGEMLTGPKKTEYLNLIAPPGKRALYLGYVNIPVGIGVGVGNYISGLVYTSYGEKATLALRYLAEHTPFGQGKNWDGAIGSLATTLNVTRNDAFAKLQEVLGKDGAACTQLLWDTYLPHYYVWLPFAAIGVVAAIALAIFGQMAKRWSDMNA